jgi:DNA-binding NtrC family response regulator
MEGVIGRLWDATAVGKLIGSAPAFLRAIGPMSNVAESDAPVLITGETGTGKELVARAIHYLSPRASFPFVPVNCGTLPDLLVEAELFGHERGAFTDAHSRRTGLITEAERGTLFLDEIDTLTRRAQVALLRVLQDQRYRPVGSSDQYQADVRVVAACNAPLEQLVQAGEFRVDLYYRLCVFIIRLPLLRDRREDIQPLARHFLQKHQSHDKPDLRLSDAAVAALLAYDWPGNVRELENTMIRGGRLCRTDVIQVEDLELLLPTGAVSEVLPQPSAPLPPFQTLKQRVIEVFEQDYLTRLMSQHRGNVSRAARTAGKERRELGKLLKKHHINPKPFGATHP